MQNDSKPKNKLEMDIADDDLFFFKDTKETEEVPEWKWGKQIKPSKEELQYRKENFKSVDVTKSYKERLRCTGCDKDMSRLVLSGKKVTHHPNLRVLFCDACKSYYECDEFSMDEDGTDKYCRWCGAGCTLYCCSKCVYGFCRKCLKKHFGAEALRKIQKNDDWLCLFCNPQPLWFLRWVCYAAKMEIKKIRSNKVEAKKTAKGELETAKVEEKEKEKNSLSLSSYKEEKAGPSTANDTENEGQQKPNESPKRRSDSPNPRSKSPKPRSESPHPRNESPEPRPSSRTSNATTVIYEYSDVAPSTVDKNADVISNNIISDVPETPQLNGVIRNRKRNRSEKESEEEKKLGKKRRKAKKRNVNDDSSESGIDNSHDEITDFPVTNKDAVKDLEGVFKITQMTSNLCDKVIEKRLGKLKLVHTYQQFCSEYSKIEQIVNCLQKHLGGILNVANHVKGKLETKFNEQTQI